MLREDCRIGMKVVFGRTNGEKTVGEVVKIHEKYAHIRTLESRGDGNRGAEEHRTKKMPAGSIWSFTFAGIEPLREPLREALGSLPPKDENLLDYLERGSETLIRNPIGRSLSMCNKEEKAILHAIGLNYDHRKYIAECIAGFRQKMSDAAPRPGECGRCDSCRSLREEREIALLEIESLTRFLDDHNHRLGLLFEALGRPVSENVYRAWEDDCRITQPTTIPKMQAPLTPERSNPAANQFQVRRIVEDICKKFSDPMDRVREWKKWNDTARRSG